jgi:hypothetical protein
VVSRIINCEIKGEIKKWGRDQLINGPFGSGNGVMTRRNST